MSFLLNLTMYWAAFLNRAVRVWSSSTLRKHKCANSLPKNLHSFPFPLFRILDCYYKVGSVSWISAAISTRANTLWVTMSWKLGVLNKVARFFSPELMCFLHKTQFCSCVEYGSHHCDGTAQYLYDALGRLQRQAIRIFNSHEGMRQTSMHIMSWHTDMEYSKNWVRFLLKFLFVPKKLIFY